MCDSQCNCNGNHVHACSSQNSQNLPKQATNNMHWLTFSINFKILIYKYLRGNGPRCVKHLLIQREVRSSTKSSQLDFKVRRTKRKTFTDKNFDVYRSKAQNQISIYIRSLDNCEPFKMHLKQAFNLATTVNRGFHDRQI